jgi:hypothetical protein
VVTHSLISPHPGGDHQPASVAIDLLDHHPSQMRQQAIDTLAIPGHEQP